MPKEALLSDAETLMLESCHGIISHRIKGSGGHAARFKAEVLQHPCNNFLLLLS